MGTMETRQAAARLSIAEQAAEWLMILEDQRPEDQAAFADWLAASPLHVGAFLRASAIDTLAAGIDPLKALPLDPGPFPDVRELRPSSPGPRYSGVLNRKTWAIAASVILTAL